MGYRINERNTGSWTTDSEPKIRRKKIDKTLSNSDRCLIGYILEEVIPKLEYDKIMLMLQIYSY